MAPHSLTLAALATSAISGLTVTSYSQLKHSSSGKLSVLIETNLGSLNVSVPTNVSEEIRQSKEILSLTALSKSARLMLPFDVPQLLGIVGYKDTRATVSSSLSGRLLSEIESEVELRHSQIAEAIAAIHSLPLQIVSNEGLPFMSVSEIRKQTLKTLDRALESGLVPEIINDRWRNIILNDSLWDFSPTVVHGNLDEDQLLFAENTLTGITGWEDLQVSDPAIDFSWTANLPYEKTLLSEYGKKSSSIDLNSLMKRVRFWQEFAIAKWLLHGVDMHNNETVKDAVLLFNELVDYVKQTPADGVSEVSPASNAEEVLDQVPENLDKSSDTAAFESLEEDRYFASENDFSEEAQASTTVSDSNNQTEPIADLNTNSETKK